MNRIAFNGVTVSKMMNAIFTQVPVNES